jgi:hypothetical protein
MPIPKLLNRLVLLIGLGLALHVSIILLTTEARSLSIIYDLKLWHYIVIICCIIIPWMGTAGRMWVWSRFLGEKIQYFEAVRVVVVSEVISAVSPTLIGGTPIRAAMLHNRGFKVSSIGFILTYSIVEDLIFYFAGIIFVIFFGGSIINQILDSLKNLLNPDVYIVLGLVAFLLITIWIWQKNKNSENGNPKNGFTQKIYNVLKDMKEHLLKVLNHGKWSMLASIIILFAQWAAKMTILVVLFYAFNIKMDTITIYIRQWITFVLMLLVPTPGASGGAEASFLLMFGNSVPRDILFLVASVWRLFTYYFILLLAVTFYLILTYVFNYNEEDVNNAKHLDS